MNKFLVKLFCRFIPNRTTRKRVRFLLNNRAYVRKCIAFVKQQGNFRDIKKIIGHGSRNLVVTADKKYVFKFPGTGNGYEKSLHEQRVTNVFRAISPIKIPDMKIMDFDGIAVRRYSYVDGINLEHFPPKKVPQDVESKIAKQLAGFL